MKEIYLKKVNGNYETFPDLMEFNNHLLCVYTESIDENNSTLTSLRCDYKSKGTSSWKTSASVLVKKGVPFWHKPKFLKNGTELIVFCSLSYKSNGFGELVYFKIDKDMVWSEPVYTGIYGVLSSSPVLLPNRRVLVLIHNKSEVSGEYEQYIWYSEDFKNWYKSETVLATKNYHYLESNIVDVRNEELLMFLREGSPTGWDLHKSSSFDGGLTWSTAEKIPFRGGLIPYASSFRDHILISFSKENLHETNKTVLMTRISKDDFYMNHQKAKFDNIFNFNDDTTSESYGFTSWIVSDDEKLIASEYYKDKTCGYISLKEFDYLGID